MNHRLFRIEHMLYAVAFLLALVIRFFMLGSVPLNNEEAVLALQAMEVSRGGSPLLDPHPAYLALTSGLMFVFNASAWVARFWPALAGSLLVLLPAFFRDRLGSLPAVLLAFFLALDPSLLAVSRQAGSLPLALLFPLLALALWRKGYRLLAGIAAGMALLSGPAVWQGLFALASAWLIAVPQKPRQSSTNGVDGDQDAPLGAPLETTSARANNGESVPWVRIITAGLVTVVLAGTLFFQIPNGLSAAAGGLAAYLRGWVMPANVPLVLLLIALVAYALLPLIFGVWGGMRGLLRSDPVDRFLLIWLAVALVLALSYPGRTVGDLLWAILPLWALAARQISLLLDLPSHDRAPVLGQALLSTVIFAFVSLTLITLANVANLPQQQVLLRLAIAALMLIASAALIAWGWSRLVAIRGLVLGLAAVLLAYTISAGWDAAGFTGKPARELYAGSPPLISGDLIETTIDDLSQWAPSRPGGLEVVVVNVPSPALRWQLRNFQRVTFIDYLPVEASPDLVISPHQPDLALAATYRGQSFVLSEETAWAGLGPVDWFRWLVFRNVPAAFAIQQQVILWARVDLFPGGMEPAGSALGMLAEAGNRPLYFIRFGLQKSNFPG